MAKLCVNIDHVATIRNARAIEEPDPLAAAVLCEMAGAVGITFHLREDRRHITDRDARQLRSITKGLLNMEMACNEEMLRIALEIRPDQVTFVPERREEVTTEGGLDVTRNLLELTRATRQLRDEGISVSMFIEPDTAQIESSREAGASHIELHTGKYARDFDRFPDRATRELGSLTESTVQAQGIGLIVNAGHGLNYRNVSHLARVPGINELNIGHAIIGRAVFVGLDRAVRDMVALISN